METGKDERMQIKLLGAICIVAGCGGFGFLMASYHKQRILLAQKLLAVFEYMECELRYRCTPLPLLCHMVTKQKYDPIGKVFGYLADELDAQISPDAERCMAAVLEKTENLDDSIRRILEDFGVNLARFDLEGQLQGIAHSKASCRNLLECLVRNKDNRIRSYQTLGLCAGAALVILFV